MSVRTWRWYCTRQQAKDQLGLTSTDTSEDSLVDDLINATSRFIEGETGRIFIPWTGTKKFDYFDARRLFLEDDLLSVTTLTNGDGNPIVLGDYFLYPSEGPPYSWIECDSSVTFFLYQTTPQQAIEVDGQWGYTNDYKDSGSLLSADLAKTATTVAVDDGTDFDIGDSILVDSEMMFAEAISSNNLTVRRAMNGTEAATHNDNAVVYIYQPPPDIVLACAILVARAHKRGKAAWSDTTGVGPSGYIWAKAMPPEVFRVLQRYKRL